MSERLAAAGLAAAWIGMLAWGVYFRRISWKWFQYDWDEQPAQFVAVFVVHSAIAFVLVWRAAGMTWDDFWRVATWQVAAS